MKKTDFIEIISNLRFPLTVLVLMIHARFLSLSGGGYNITIADYPVYWNISYYITEILARIAVPSFFIFSGFLFFNNIDHFNFTIYRTKIKKRIRSLLIPYLFWNAVVVMFYYLQQTFAPSLAGNTHNLVVNYNIDDWVHAFWTDPISYPLWYVRDLMIVCVISPVIYFLIKRSGLIFPLLMLVLWLFRIDLLIRGDVEAVAFFSLGSFMSLKDNNGINICKKALPFTIISSIVLTILEILTLNSVISLIPEDSLILKVIHSLNVLSLIMICIAVASILLDKGLAKRNETLDKSCFFVYCFHALPIILFTILLARIMAPTNDINALAIYFISPAITLIIGVLLYYLINKFFPKFCAIITGGRR